MDAILEHVFEIAATDKTAYSLKSICEGISIDYHYLLTTINLSRDEELQGVMHLCLCMIHSHVLDAFLHGAISQKEALELVEIVEQEQTRFPGTLENMHSMLEALKGKYQGDIL